MRIPNQTVGVARGGSGVVAGAQRVIPQLRNIGGGVISGGGLSIWGWGWCDAACALACASCIAGTSGAGILLCEAAYIACEKACHPD